MVESGKHNILELKCLYLYRFDNVRIPRDNLLNKYANVTEDGKYETSIPHAGTRFNTTIGKFSSVL